MSCSASTGVKIYQNTIYIRFEALPAVSMKLSLMGCSTPWRPSALQHVPPSRCTKLRVVTAQKAVRPILAQFVTMDGSSRVLLIISSSHKVINYCCLLHTTYLYLHLMNRGVQNSKQETGHQQHNMLCNLFPKFTTCYKSKKCERINKCLQEKVIRTLCSLCLTLTENGTSDYRHKRFLPTPVLTN